jgi:hypothetical protein
MHMKHRHHKFITIGLIAILLAIAGCSSHGYLSRNRGEQDTRLADLVANSDQYTVHYHGNSEQLVSGILFDPGGDGKSIRPDGVLWQEVNDPETIAFVIDNIRQGDYHHSFPRLYRVNGPNGDLYGFLFTGWSYMVIKPVDDHTLRVFGLKGPPEYEDIYPGGR